MERRARYDDVADWYEHEFMGSPLDDVARELVLRLLPDGSGKLLDIGFEESATGEDPYMVALRCPR